MEKIKLSFQQENDIVLNYILNTSLLNKLKSPLEKQKESGVILELNITSVCNQKCEYCYLVKYGNELYPPEIRNEKNILDNIDIFLEYLYENNYQIYEISLFSGEIWGMEFGNKVFNKILKYLKKGFIIKTIMIPSNMSFLTNEKATEIVEDYIRAFEFHDCSLLFSASFDGKYIDSETRPYKNKNKNILKSNEEFYEKLFSFCKKHNYGFHPMIGAYKIENWIENVKWYFSMFKKYDFDPFRHIMFLEVRNDYWDERSIDEYLKFLDFFIDYEIENFFDGDKGKFANYIFQISKEKKNVNYEILKFHTNENYIPGCTIARSLIVRMGDLAIGPCHRTHYEKFIYGYFIKENDKIVGIKANNIQMANRILLGTLRSHPICSGCLYSKVCMKGCFGAQYEANEEILAPCESVCKLFKNKNNFLIYKYEKMGLLDYVKESKNFIINEIEKIKNGEEYKEWIEKNFQK